VVVREEALARYPGLRAALEELSGALSGEVMRKLNYRVEGQRRPVRDVAAEFLRTVANGSKY
jgi:glycine betaine/choline ABC-type transport system substrate-binding protein